MASDSSLRLRYEVAQLFTPATPIDEQELFAGRKQQIGRILDAISQRGRHVVVFGERGVGKTSLVRVLPGHLKGIERSILAPRVACDSSDDYSSLWRRIFDQLCFERPVRSMGLKPDVATEKFSIADRLPKRITPDVVRTTLAELGDEGLVIVIVDEFDRLRGPENSKLFADTIKTLADDAIKATLILVGVADAVEELLAGHESISRNLVQIPVPRMSEVELRKIVTDRLPRVGMSITDVALGQISLLSRGLPHYTHLIGQHAAWRAIDDGLTEISEFHLGTAMPNAIADAQHTIQIAYHRATISSRQAALHAQVLLACALASCDQFGFFAAADVRRPIRSITGRDYDIPAFVRHLKEFAGEARGAILQQTGDKHRRRFRFRNPLMQPYIVIRGIADGLITLDQARDCASNASRDRE